MPEMPNLSLYYWFRGQSPDAWYTVEVSSDMTIGQLKNLIAQGWRILSQCDPEVLNVYKVPVDQPVVGDASLEHNLGSLSISMLGTPLRSWSVLSGIFTSLPKGQLNLIVGMWKEAIRAHLLTSFVVADSSFSVEC